MGGAKVGQPPYFFGRCWFNEHICAGYRWEHTPYIPIYVDRADEERESPSFYRSGKTKQRGTVMPADGRAAICTARQTSGVGSVWCRHENCSAQCWSGNNYFGY